MTEKQSKGCGKPLSNPFFVHWKCGENNLYCKECEKIQHEKRKQPK